MFMKQKTAEDSCEAVSELLLSKRDFFIIKDLSASGNFMKNLARNFFAGKTGSGVRWSKNFLFIDRHCNGSSNSKSNVNSLVEPL